jgi:hypothetical protein
MLKNGDTTGLKAFLLLADGAWDHDTSSQAQRDHRRDSKTPLCQQRPVGKAISSEGRRAMRRRRVDQRR